LALKGKMIGVSFPDTILEEKGSLREKTWKLGLIARACAIYGVDTIEVFRDSKGRGESELITKVLRFLETPQYLRRRLFPLDADLQFAGLLPPLRIPSHRPKVDVGRLRVGDVREGVVNPDGTADVGLDTHVELRGKTHPNSRLTVRIVGLNPVAGVAVSRGEVKEYWGYDVESKSAEEVFDDKRFGVKVATSRKGESLTSRIDDLRKSIAGCSGVKLVFGSPSRGLLQIVGKDIVEKSDYVLNLFVEQKVETVRSEEAIFAGLNLVNVLAAEKA
jgi:predicted SPOUT superfamily RNA methylase MTH1